MNADPNETLAGVAIRALRPVFRSLNDGGPFDSTYLCKRLKLSPGDGGALLQELLARGLVQPAGAFNRETYQITLAGSALANANFGKPVSQTDRGGPPRSRQGPRQRAERRPLDGRSTSRKFASSEAG